VDSYSFDLDDFLADLDGEAKQRLADGPREAQTNMADWPYAGQKLAIKGVRLGKASVNFWPNTKGGKRPFNIGISVPGIIELDGQNYSSFIKLSTAGNVGLARTLYFMKTFNAPNDPVLAAARARQAVIDGYFKHNSYNPDYPYYELYDGFTLLEAPNLESADTDLVKVNDRREGVSSGSSPRPSPAPAPAAAARRPQPGAPSARPAPRQSPAPSSGDGDGGNFWEV
jgi:hypothetical protein